MKTFSCDYGLCVAPMLRLSAHVRQWTVPTATVYTDGWRGYTSIQQTCELAFHKDGEWARDADGKGLSYSVKQKDAGC